MKLLCQRCGSKFEVDDDMPMPELACPHCDGELEPANAVQLDAAATLEAENAGGNVITAEKARYWAFISYSSKDRAWGQWLHKKLETYPIPKDLRGIMLDDQSVVPKHLKPVFRDRDELPASDDLSAKILQALAWSRYLVVLCSPNSAQSQWVDKEIRDFRAMGRGGRILALIIAGEPNARNPARECFPPSLRYPYEPIAGDLRPEGDGRSKGFLKILAGLAQLNFDLLYRRDQKRKTTQRLMWTVATLVLAGVLGVTWSYTMRAHEMVSSADQKAREEAAKAAEQAEIASAERVKTQQAKEEAERQKRERAKQEEIAKSMGEETARQQELNTKMGAETRLNRVRQIMLPKAQKAMEEREFPLNALYAAVALGFRGFGYENLPEVDKALFDSKFPPFFDPKEHPEFKRDFLRAIRGETRLLLPVWTALHTDVVNCVAYSPDGKFVATGSDDKTIRFWDVATGKEMAVLAGHERDVISLAFSPDMKTLASGSWDSTVRLWDIPSRMQKHKLEGHQRGVTGLAFSPDGMTLASASRDCSIRLWGRQRRILAGRDVQMDRYCLALSRDGKLIATGSHSAQLATTEWATGKTQVLLKTEEDGENYIYSVAFSPNGKLLASGGVEGTAKEGLIRLWDVSTGSLAGVLRGHRDAVRSLAFSPDGETLASGSDDKMIILWDIVERVRMAALVGHSKSVQSVAFSPCGNALVSGGADKTVKLWDIAPTKEEMTISGVSSSRGVGDLSFSADGTMLAVGDGIRKLADPEVGLLSASLKNYSGGNIIFGPKDGLVAIARGKVALWDMKGPETFLSGVKTCHEMAFSPDGLMMALFALEDGAVVPKGGNPRDYSCIQLWDTKSNTVIRSIRDEKIRSPEFFFLDGGKTLIAHEGGTIHWFSVEKGEKIRTTRLPFAMDNHTFITFSGDGSTVAGSNSSTTHEVLIWDVVKDQERKRMTLPPDRDAVPRALSYDGKILALSDYRGKWSRKSSTDSIVLFDVESGEEIEELGGQATHHMVFSHDGRLLATRTPTEQSHIEKCTIWLTAPTSPDLASYFLRGWYAFDQTTGEIIPAAPPSGGSINMSDRCKFLRPSSATSSTVVTQPTPVVTPSVARTPVSTQSVPDKKPPSTPLSRMELKAYVRTLSSKTTKSFLRFRIDVRNGELEPFIGGAVTVMLVGKSAASAPFSLIWKEVLPLDLKPLSTKNFESKSTDGFDLTAYSFGTTNAGPTYAGYVCAIQDSTGKVMAITGSTLELERIAEGLLSLEVGETLK